MTTTVKGAGRAKQAANARHQQRTPLPPKDGSQDSTPEALAADAAEALAEIKTPAKVTPRKRTAAKAAAPKPVAKTVLKTLGNNGVNDKKIARIVEATEGTDWVVTALTVDSIEVGRGTERLTTYFADGKLDATNMPLYADGDRKVRLRNVSAVLLQMSGERPSVRPPAVRKARAPRVAGAPRKASAGVKAPADGGASPFPFDLSTATDEEVRAAVADRAISWVNRVSQAVEQSFVQAHKTVKDRATGEPVERSVPIKIEARADGSRVLNFYTPEGQRSVALAQIVRVGK